MATVNFVKYKTQRAATLRGVIAYVCQREKTGISRENLDAKHQVRSNNQQCEIKLISGLNCTPETAYAEFISTKASYHKTDGLQFYHYTQSFKEDENISPKMAHEIAMKLAEEHYKDFEVLIATHMDNDHLHSHFIINSVSFETGKKLHQPPNTLRKLRLTSDNICKEYGLSTLETYTYGRSKTMGRAERRARERGTSWKFQLCLAIETAMKKAKSKDDFITEMINQGYEVKWEDGRQTITYTGPNGKKVRDDKLYGKKYLKENMEREFEIRQGDCTSDIKTGWEYEREELLKPQPKPTKALTLEVGKEILYTLNQFEQAQNYDDELAEIADLAALTALSFVGVYALIEMMNSFENGEIKLSELDTIIEELKQEPENTQEFEEEQEQDFTMTIGGY
ncbi:relaxase/mobilization nuclease domain-containing protein [Chakrabartyella piscis]|uniref:relaxase/mobilization nuclease domain-containing protein n=1 Tax=Chakrabartyella piscis TaxID=2918914 RepID=UPI002958897C|nr:relaxase/mobilization nuclease domain-containing protein [Chakrabartyella piscis]